MAHHTFTPDHYHTAIGTHPPVLEIASGDSVSTTTVDARGQDHTGQRVTPRGNPQTGPFFITGAEPGDALVVTFDRLIPNRPRGFTGGRVAPNVLDPDYSPSFTDERDLILWDIDYEKEAVRPVDPPAATASLELPLNPMVGCFGVAPPRGQAISTATSSTHGGNMDFNGFVQGVTVTFPVFVDGALFFLGDGHARQGDGEIVGTGIEISFDVTFSVNLLKGKSIQWPRAENATHIMTVGNARPLDQCVQHATTEMVRWLCADYALDERSAHMILGQAVEYKLGNMYDPAYTMVCTVAKNVLEGLH
jgi:amidase